MIVWGSCVATWERARKWLLPGLAKNVFDDDLVVLTQADSIAVAYNRVLDAAPDGYIVVLLHDDTELGAGAWEAITAAEGDVVGVAGAKGVASLAWWDHRLVGAVDTSCGRVHWGDHGPVDTLDGLLLAFSPRATGLRFDEGYDGFHGYDADICMQAHAAGLDVVTAEIPLVHHSTGGYGDRAAWDRAAKRWREKWR